MKARLVGEITPDTKGDIYRAVAQISYIVYFASLAEMFGKLSEDTFDKYILWANDGLSRSAQLATPKNERQASEELKILKKFGLDCYDCFRKTGKSHEENAYTLHSIGFISGVRFRFPGGWTIRTVKRFVKIYQRNYTKIKLNQIKPSELAHYADERIGHTAKDKGATNCVLLAVYGDKGNPFTEEHLDRIAAVLWCSYKAEAKRSF